MRHTFDEMTQISVEIITGVCGFETLEQAWTDLFDRAGRSTQLFQSYAWLKLWIKHYPSEFDELVIVAGWRGDALAMVWPLVKKRAFGLTSLSWMGEPVSLYGDALVETGPGKDELLRQGWARIVALDVDVVKLFRVRADAAVAPLLATVAARRMTSTVSPWLDLASAPDFATYEKRYRTKARSERRRRMRRLEDRHGKIVFKHYDQGEEISKIIRIAMAQKRTWARSKRIDAKAILDPRFENFFIDVARSGNEEVRVRASVMQCEDVALGVDISLLCGDWVFAHVISTHRAFANQHVGELLAENLFRTACEGGFSRYDLSLHATPFKMKWADACEEYIIGRRHYRFEDDYGFPCGKVSGLCFCACRRRCDARSPGCGRRPRAIWRKSTWNRMEARSGEAGSTANMRAWRRELHPQKPFFMAFANVSKSILVCCA